MLLVSTSPKFQSFSLYGQPFCFWVTRYFETSAPNDPQITLNLQDQMYTMQMLLESMSPKLHSVSFYNHQAFFDTGHFKTSASNDPQITLNLRGQRYPLYIERERYMLLVSTSPKFQAFLLYNQPFSRYWPFWDNTQNDPKMILSPTTSNILHMYL